MQHLFTLSGMSDHDQRPPFAAAVHYLRLCADLTQAELAERVGVGPMAVHHWEVRGSIPRRRATIRALAEVLDVPSETLFELAARSAPPPADARARLVELETRLAALESELRSGRDAGHGRRGAAPARHMPLAV